MKNYLFYDEETGEYFFVQEVNCGKLTRPRISSFSVPFTSVP